MLTLGLKMLATGFIASTAIVGGNPSTMPKTITLATSYAKLGNQIVFNEKTPLDKWINRLVWLESKGNTQLKILDSNGRNSFGCLQFQRGTFREFGLKYGFLSPTDKIGNLIYNCALQKKIAKKIIENDYNDWIYWYTSVIVKKLGLPPREEEQTLLSLK